MSKPTEQEIEQKLAESIYEVMTSEIFHKFYMSKSIKSLEAHISRYNENCPTKEQILNELKIQFYQVIKVTKELINES